LRAFCERITERTIWAYTPDGDVCRKARNAASSWMTLTQGQPGFFIPRQQNPWLSFSDAQSATSFYDSALLRDTLGRRRSLRKELADMPDITILQLIYQQKAYEGHAKDYEFSGTSRREHRQSGYEDTRRTLRRKDWLAMPPHGAGVVVHDVHREDEHCAPRSVPSIAAVAARSLLFLTMATQSQGRPGLVFAWFLLAT
jgi:Patatin phospholipase